MKYTHTHTHTHTHTEFWCQGECWSVYETRASSTSKKRLRLDRQLEEFEMPITSIGTFSDDHPRAQIEQFCVAPTHRTRNRTNSTLQEPRSIQIERLLSLGGEGVRNQAERCSKSIEPNAFRQSSVVQSFRYSLCSVCCQVHVRPGGVFAQREPGRRAAPERRRLRVRVRRHGPGASPAPFPGSRPFPRVPPLSQGPAPFPGSRPFPRVPPCQLLVIKSWGKGGRSHTDQVTCS